MLCGLQSRMSMMFFMTVRSAFVFASFKPFTALNNVCPPNRRNIGSEGLACCHSLWYFKPQLPGLAGFLLFWKFRLYVIQLIVKGQLLIRFLKCCKIDNNRAPWNKSWKQSELSRIWSLKPLQVCSLLSSRSFLGPSIESYKVSHHSETPISELIFIIFYHSIFGEVNNYAGSLIIIII